MLFQQYRLMMKQYMASSFTTCLVKPWSAPLSTWVCTNMSCSGSWEYEVFRLPRRLATGGSWLSCSFCSLMCLKDIRVHLYCPSITDIRSYAVKGLEVFLHVFLVAGQVLLVHQLQSESRFRVLPHWQNLKPTENTSIQLSWVFSEHNIKKKKKT